MLLTFWKSCPPLWLNFGRKVFFGGPPTFLVPARQLGALALMSADGTTSNFLFNIALATNERSFYQALIDSMKL